MTNQFNGTIMGTVNPETGAMATSVGSIQRVYFAGFGTDNPCPKCLGDAAPNDGLAGGTCSGGANDGASCDANGSVPGRPDFGSTSLDCPPTVASLVATQSLDRDNTTEVVTKPVSSGSPRCTGSPSGAGAALPVGAKCLCDTCNNANAEPCADNADCPDPAGPVEPICGGKRCLGSTNDGTPCSNGSECPGGGFCGRAGEPTLPSGCFVDDSAGPVLDAVGCADTAPIDGEGECPEGPVTGYCSAASGHAQRVCVTDAECGGEVGSCQQRNRSCFLTGPYSSYPKGQGTCTLVAEGMADTPVADTFSPTLAAVFCSRATTSAALNVVFGLPGPVRETLRGPAVFHP